MVARFSYQLITEVLFCPGKEHQGCPLHSERGAQPILISRHGCVTIGRLRWFTKAEGAKLGYGHKRVVSRRCRTPDAYHVSGSNAGRRIQDPKWRPARHRRGPGIEVSGLIPPRRRRRASELTLGATAHEAGGERALLRQYATARRLRGWPSSKQGNTQNRPRTRDPD